MKPARSLSTPLTVTSPMRRPGRPGWPRRGGSALLPAPEQADERIPPACRLVDVRRIEDWQRLLLLGLRWSGGCRWRSSGLRGLLPPGDGACRETEEEGEREARKCHTALTSPPPAVWVRPSRPSCFRQRPPAARMSSRRTLRGSSRSVRPGSSLESKSR